MHVCDVMVRGPITVRDDASIREAMRVMDQHEIRHLPVVRSQALVGVLSDRDLLAAVGWLVPRVGDDVELARQLVRHAMQPHPLTVDPDETLSRAASVLVEWGVGCLPVVRGGALVGLVTTVDLLEALAAACRYGPLGADEDPHVERLMHAAVTTADPTTTLAEAQRLLVDGDFHHLPVLEGAGCSAWCPTATCAGRPAPGATRRRPSQRS